MTETLGALVRYASDDSLHILRYLAGLGIAFRCLDGSRRSWWAMEFGCYSRPVSAPISVACRSE
jgi:hypothetical protein